jgi:pSer/pThr/pTyr-binding forkhead associated (FHA) protein
MIEEAYRVLINPISLRKYLEDLKPVKALTANVEKDSTLLDPLSALKLGLQHEKQLIPSGKRQKTEIYELENDAPHKLVPPVSAIQKSGRQQTELIEPGSIEMPPGGQQAAPSIVPDGHNKRPRTEMETTEPTPKSEEPASNTGQVKRIQTTPEGTTPEKKKSKTRASIICMYAGEKNEYPLKEGENTIGRTPLNGNPPDVPLKDADRYISRSHAVILVKGSKYLLQDMGSDNGSSLNGERLQPSTYYPLKDGDVIEIEERQLIVNIS